MKNTINAHPQATSILRVLAVFLFCAVVLNNYVVTAQTFAQAESNGNGTGASASASSSGGGSVAAFAQSNGDGTGTVVIIGQPNGDGNVAAQAQIEIMRDGLREQFGLTFSNQDGFRIFGNIPLNIAIRDFRVMLPELHVLGGELELTYFFDLAHFVMQELQVE